MTKLEDAALRVAKAYRQIKSVEHTESQINLTAQMTEFYQALDALDQIAPKED